VSLLGIDVGTADRRILGSSILSSDARGAEYARELAVALGPIASGCFRDASEAVGRFVAVARTFHPDPGRHDRYCERLGLFRRLLPLAGGILREL
jgi:hypothetical protein